MRDLRSKTMVDVWWALASVAFASLAHFLLRIILGRELGPDGLGVYTLAFSIYLIGQQFAALGMGSALTKFTAEHLGDEGTIRRFVSSGMTGSLISGALMGVVLFLLAPLIAVPVFGTPQLEDPIRLIALSFPFIAAQKAVLGTLNGLRRMRAFALVNILQNVAVVALSIALVLFWDAGVPGAVIGLVAPTVVVGVLCPLTIRGSIDRGSSWDLPALRAVAVFGAYIGAGNAVGYLNTQLDSLLIGAYMSPSDVGVYAVAVLLAQALLLLPSAIQRVTMPATATIYGRGDVEGTRRLFYSTLRKSFFLTAGSAALLAATGMLLIPTVFGGEYLASYQPLLVLLLGYTVSGSFTSVGATLSSIGKAHVPVRIGAVCAAVSVVLNLVLIPAWGILGAAVATSTTLAVNSVITVAVVDHYLRPPLQGPRVDRKVANGQV